MRARFISLGLITLTLYALIGRSMAAEHKITFAANPSSAKQQEVYHLLAQRFEALNPDISVVVSSQSLESHKQRVQDFYNGETNNIDVMLAYAGTQLQQLIDSEDIQPLNTLWEEYELDQRFSQSIKQLVSKQKIPFAIPMAYYQWGIYYHKSLFERLELAIPTNWPEFIALINTLKENDITPLNFSGGSTWSSLAWFDYLSLRILGKDKYLALVKGKLPFTTPEVKEVFSHWHQLIQAGAFDRDHRAMTWSEILPFFYRRKMAMMLNGNFFLAHVPEHVRKDVGFFPFPRIREDMPRYESAPTDVAVLNANSDNLPAARKFIAFLASLEAQTLVANYVGKIAPHVNYQPTNRYLLNEGKAHLESANGLVQYFDREASEQFTAAAGTLFIDFMCEKLTVDSLIEQLEIARKQDLLE